MPDTVLRIPVAEVFEPLLAPSPLKGAWGGRGSGKSHFFGDEVIRQCVSEPGSRFLCVREIQESIKDSVKRLLEDKIAYHNVGHLFTIKGSEIIAPGEGLISFVGMQNHTAQSIKSLEGYKRAWVEEAQTLSQYSLDLLLPTIRAPQAEVWFSWNPRHKTDPVDKFLRANPPPDAVVVKATYHDNPWFPDVLRARLEWDLQTDPGKYAHVWLGEYQDISDLQVFKKGTHWRIHEGPIPTPDPSTVFYFGADWGFSVDPTVLVRCWIGGLENRTLFVDREVYKIGCEIENTPALFDTLEAGQARRWPIIADSARPETISHMRSHGYGKIQPAKKGAGSVEEGITFLQNYQMVVDPRCVNVIDELTRYSYKQDKLTGAVLPILEDKKNHTIDALRYAVESVRAIKPAYESIGHHTTRQEMEAVRATYSKW